MTKKKRGAGKKGKLEANWSIRPTDDLREFVKSAIEATGIARSPLLIEAIRIGLKAAVNGFLIRQTEAEQARIRAKEKFEDLVRKEAEETTDELRKAASQTRKPEHS